MRYHACLDFGRQLVGRLGGEEFVRLGLGPPETAARRAHLILRRLRALPAQADERLYEAERGGRDRIVRPDGVSAGIRRTAADR